jgi:hypothetical protein
MGNISRMSPLPAEFILLNRSVFQSLAACLSDLSVSRYSALFFLADNTVAIHDGYTIMGVGPEFSDVYECLKSAMGDKPDGVIVVDRNEREAWWAPRSDATEFLKQRNSPPPGYVGNDKQSARLIH